MVSEADETQFQQWVDEIWNGPNIYDHFNWKSILDQESIVPDLQIKNHPDINFMHRKTHAEDIYFLYNPDSVARRLQCTFRVQQKIPELWNPRNGEVKRSGQFVCSDESIKVWLDLEALESVFVVFRASAKGVLSVSDPGNRQDMEFYLDRNQVLIAEADQNMHAEVELSSGKTIEVVVEDLPKSFEIEGSWDVEFLKEHDYAGKHRFDHLLDWKDHPEENIKYYSGTAIYRNSFEWKDGLADEQNQYIMELGNVKIVAEVFLNGVNLGVHRMDPFSMNISEALRQGANVLEIKITNQWSNKLIGDERFPFSFSGYKLEGNFPKGIMMDWYVKNQPLPSGERTTFCTAPFYRATDELMPSGLLGPVQIRVKKVEKLPIQ